LIFRAWGNPSPFILIELHSLDKKKAIFLFLGLALPVLIFIFLRVLGKNRFDVPLLYAEGVTAPADCNWKYDAPYIVPDTLWKKLEPAPGVKLIGVLYGVPNAAVKKLFDPARLELKLIEGDGLELEDRIAALYRDCLLLVKEYNTLVLIDDKRQIRGHYLIYDQDEIDRLKMETDILLEKY
jgi:hypothetical protein